MALIAVMGIANDEMEMIQTGPVSIDHCYTIEDIMIILGISKPTAYNLLKKDYFRYVKIGRGYRISRKSLDEWLDTLHYLDGRNSVLCFGCL